ncbi:MAG: helix-turn-helix transcriptional regulator [Bacteroidales bacterium]|nr:helix-turn-helix transcriptional regulator [Bacteroidales bacterium]HNW73481.1 helix-turn-helix transcriptional regulator [Bacteroidales bacterium]HPS51655.1 helix-turn-helix transcriptional regulator [Bacteroidales bacterium]
MNKIFKLDNVSDYNKLVDVETLHPLVSVIDLSKTINSDRPHTHLNFGIYAIFLKDLVCGELGYGRGTYDYQEGTLVFIAPGQVVQITRREPGEQGKGWVLLFHPDLIHGTSLGRSIRDYSFFSYDTNEALHISERERKIVTECFSKIAYEIEQRIDKHSRKLIVSNIHLFLDYCIRFYDRQFLTRVTPNKGIIEKFESELEDYFSSEKPSTDGLPSVGYFAEKLHLSSNYFGDLIKRETGKSALEYIHLKLINIAKEKIFDTSKSISEISFELGFKYPQHFTRLFKNETGYTPNEYRILN